MTKKSQLNDFLHKCEKLYQQKRFMKLMIPTTKKSQAQRCKFCRRTNHDSNDCFLKPSTSGTTSIPGKNNEKQKTFNSAKDKPDNSERRNDRPQITKGQGDRGKGQTSTMYHQKTK